MCSVSASQEAKLRPQPFQRHACAAGAEQSCSGVGVGGAPSGPAADGGGVEDEEGQAKKAKGQKKATKAAKGKGKAKAVEKKKGKGKQKQTLFTLGSFPT